MSTLSKLHVFKLYDVVHFDLCLHQKLSLTIKVVDIPIALQIVLWPLVIRPCNSTYFLDFYIHGIIRTVFWSGFFLSHCCSISISLLLLLNNIPLYGYTTVCLPIHFLMGIWVVSSFIVINKVAMNIHVFVWTYSFLSLG